MPDVKQNNESEPFVSASERPSGAELAAVIVSLAWIAIAAIYFFYHPVEGGNLGLVMTGLIVLLPIALLWVAVSMSRSVRSLRNEAARLQAAVDAMRNAFVAHNQAGAGSLKPLVEKKLNEIAAAQRQTETALATFASRSDPAQTVPPADRKAALAAPLAWTGGEQQTLALGTPAEDLRPPLSVADFIRALNFPETPDDKAGFRALRLALEDRTLPATGRGAADRRRPAEAQAQVGLRLRQRLGRARAADRGRREAERPSCAGARRDAARDPVGAGDGDRLRAGHALAQRAGPGRAGGRREPPRPSRLRRRAPVQPGSTTTIGRPIQIGEAARSMNARSSSSSVRPARRPAGSAAAVRNASSESNHSSATPS